MNDLTDPKVQIVDRSSDKGLYVNEDDKFNEQPFSVS